MFSHKLQPITLQKISAKNFTHPVKKIDLTIIRKCRIIIVSRGRQVKRNRKVMCLPTYLIQVPARYEISYEKILQVQASEPI